MSCPFQATPQRAFAKGGRGGNLFPPASSSQGGRELLQLVFEGADSRVSCGLLGGAASRLSASGGDGGGGHPGASDAAQLLGLAQAGRGPDRPLQGRGRGGRAASLL